MAVDGDPPEKHEIVAVVVTHQSGTTIAACLSRLRKADGISQIRIVDNGSTDTTIDIVQRHTCQDARIHLIPNPDNPGFAAACNQGLNDSDAPWVAFVNPDCMVDTQTLSRLVQYAIPYQGKALLGAALVNGNGQDDPATRRRAPQFARMLWSKAARNLSIPADPTLVLQPVEAISGALMLTSRQLLKQMGGLDSGYRLHVEDLDLCRRVQAHGAAVLVANDIRVLHLGGISSRTRPLFVEWHKHRGLWRYFCKFEAANVAPVTIMLVWLGLWLHFPWMILRGGGGE